MRIVLLSLILILILILVGTVWNGVTVKEQQRKRNRLEDARAICLARGGAVLNRQLELPDQEFIPIGKRWCSVNRLRAPEVKAQIMLALKP